MERKTNNNWDGGWSQYTSIEQRHKLPEEKRSWIWEFVGIVVLGVSVWVLTVIGLAS